MGCEKRTDLHKQIRFKSKYKNYEVIAVSDGSNDHSIEIANKYSCKIIKLKKN